MASGTIAARPAGWPQRQTDSCLCRAAAAAEEEEEEGVLGPLSSSCKVDHFTHNPKIKVRGKKELNLDHGIHKSQFDG